MSAKPCREQLLIPIDRIFLARNPSTPGIYTWIAVVVVVDDDDDGIGRHVVDPVVLMMECGDGFE